MDAWWFLLSSLQPVDLLCIGAAVFCSLYLLLAWVRYSAKVLFWILLLTLLCVAYSRWDTETVIAWLAKWSFRGRKQLHTFLFDLRYPLLRLVEWLESDDLLSWLGLEKTLRGAFQGGIDTAETPSWFEHLFD